MSARECPTGCGRTVKAGHLACGPCWGSVPRHLQRDVWTTWRAWQRDMASADRMRAYKAASEAALASVP